MLYPATLAWMKRIKAYGQGTRPQRIGRADGVRRGPRRRTCALGLHEALTVVDPSGLQSGPTRGGSPRSHGARMRGRRIDWLERNNLTLRLQSERCGTVHVHFPRTGYRVKPLTNAS